MNRVVQGLKFPPVFDKAVKRMTHGLNLYVSVIK